MKKYLYLLIIIILANCDPHNDDDCSQLYKCNSVIAPSYYFSNNSNHYFSPIFNPNDPNEIMYLKMHVDSMGFDSISLERFNLNTLSHSIVISPENMISFNLDFWKYNWSQSGLIVLENDYDSQIYKIGDNGLGLVQLTYNGNSFFPNFTCNGSKIFFSNYSGSQYMGILMDPITEQFLDTIYNQDFSGTFGLTTSLSSNKIICSQQNGYISIIDEAELSFIENFQIPNSNGNITFLRNIGSNTNEVIVQLGYNGLYKLNLISHTITLLKPGCTDRLMTSPSVSSDGTKIAYALYKDENNEIEPCLIKRTYEIHLMNIDGSNDQVLNLP